MREKVSERKQLRYGCPFNLVRDSTTYEQNHLDFVNQHIVILGRNRFYYSKTDCIGMGSRAPLNFTGHLPVLTAKILSAELAGVFYKK